MKRTNIYLGDVQPKRLKTIGKEKGLKVSEIIQRMIDQGLKKYEKKMKENEPVPLMGFDLERG